MSEVSAAQNTVKSENILGTEKIGKLLLKFSVPGIVSMLVNSIYNLVDQIFIGHGVGYLGNAATNVNFPFVQMMLALSIMVAAGTAANVGLNLGRKQEEEADHYVGTGFVLALASGVFVMIVGEIFMTGLLYFFGCTDMVLPYALDYGRIVLIGFPFVSCGILMSDLIRADGSPRYSMIAMVSGAVFNIVFDPIFIFVFHWGVKGAALATILGQIVTFLINLRKMPHLQTIHFRKEDFLIEFHRVKQIILIGMSAFLTQMAGLVGNILLNNQAVKYGAMSVYGAEIPLTCFGIIMKINQIMMSVIMGITTSTQPIFSYNYGAAKYARIRELMKKTAIITFLVGVTGCLVFQIFPQQIINIFGQESELYNEFAVMCLRNMTLLIFVMGIPMMAGTYFQSVGKPLKAVILSLSRQIIFQIPIMIFLPMLIGITGVMYTFPLADIASITLAGILLAKEMKLLKEMEIRHEELQAQHGEAV